VTSVGEEWEGAIRICAASAMNDAISSFLASLGNALTSPIFAMSLVAAIVIVFVYHQVIARQAFSSARSMGDRKSAATNPSDAAALRARVDALEANAARSLQRVGFVRFNAFPDVGSELE